VSLNPNEQQIWDYIQKFPEERQHWLNKVQRLCSSAVGGSSAIASIEIELWNYYVERANVVPIFREQARREGLQRTSMRNLSEYLVRIWTEPIAKKKAATPGRP
jgi:hypothetical protein